MCVFLLHVKPTFEVLELVDRVVSGKQSFRVSRLPCSPFVTSLSLDQVRYKQESASGLTEYLTLPIFALSVAFLAFLCSLCNVLLFLSIRATLWKSALLLYLKRFV